MKHLNTPFRLRMSAVALILLLGAVSFSAIMMRRASASSSRAAAQPLTFGTCDTAGAIEVESSGGTAAGTPTPYATLALAFTAINGGVTHTGTITIDVCGNTTETGTATLNQVAGVTSVAISPAGGAARTISGAITAGSPLIDFSGADNVTIDGLNTGGNSLTISNTTASTSSGTSTIRFINGATNNTVTNSTISGSFSAGVTTNGGNIFFSTDGTTANGNDNNTISNNNIGPAGANLPTKGIYMNGSTTTTAIGNSGNNIAGNNIFDFFGAAVTSSGVYVGGGNTDNNFTNNKFYQTATRTQTTGAQHSAIWVANSSGNNFQITGNTIGFATANGTGTYTLVGVASTTFVPVFLNVGTTTATSVQNNTISNIAMSGVLSGATTSGYFRAFYVSSGLVNVGNVTGNTVGSQSATGNMTFTSSSTSAGDVVIYANNGSSAVVFSNNSIGGISVANSSTGAAAFYVAFANTATSSTATYSNNTIGGTVADSISVSASSTSSNIIGIRNNSASFAPAMTATGNTIRNLTINSANTGTGTSSSAIGILHSNTTPTGNTISQNTIYNLTNTNASGAVSVSGIVYNGASSGTNLVARNLVYNLTTPSTSATATINGISAVAGTTTYQNNMIAVGNGMTNGAIINGIAETGGTDNFYHNSVYIGGTNNGATAANTFAFNSTVTTNTRNYRDNIFFNARSNGTGTGKHYAIRVGGTAANPAGLTSNNNVLYITGTGGFVGLFNAVDRTALTDWQTATGQDGSSFSSDPKYLAPTAATPDLHIDPTQTTVIEGNGAAVGVTDDFDGQTRSTLTPTDIGADAGNFIGIDLTLPVITYTALGNTTLTTDRTLSITVTDASGVPTSGIGLPVLYFRKGTSGAYSSSQCVSAGGSNYTCTFTFASVGGVTAGDTIQYYVAAQDSAATPNVTTNPSTGASGFTANPPAASTPPTSPNSYLIAVAYNGSLNVGTGETYTSLTNTGGLFQSLNSGVLTGNLTINITSNLTGETGTFALAQQAEEGAGAGTYTVTIKPSGAARTITSTTTATGVIGLLGADRVTIDGSLSGGTDRSLSIINANTTTSGTSVVAVYSLGTGAGATSNTIKNTIIQNGTKFESSTSSFNFGIYVGGNGVAAGPDNDNLTIQNNLVQRANIGMQIVGGASPGALDNLVVSDNTVGGTATADFIGLDGMILSNATGANITRNTVRNHLFTAALDGAGIILSTGFVNSSVTRNTINNLEANNSGGYGMTGIYVITTNAASNLTIANNFIYDIRGTSWTTGVLADTVVGIRVAGAGTGGVNIWHNSVNLYGSYAGASGQATVTAAFMVNGTSITALDVRDNIFVNTFDNTLGTGDKSYAIYTSTANTMFSDINYNDYFVSGTPGVLGAINATDTTTLAALKTATTKDAQSQNLNPQFTSNTDLHLNGTNMQGIGLLLAAVNNDYDNDLRDTPPDIGADEVVTGRTGPIPAGTYRDANMGASSLSGNVTITGTLTLSGIVNTNSNTLTVDCGASATGGGPSSFVDGNLRKNYCGAENFTYPVGTTTDGNEYSPVMVNVTAATNPSSLTVDANKGTAPASPPLVDGTTLDRFWTLTETGDLTADVVFNYLQTDVDGNEANYQIIKTTGGVAVRFPDSCPTVSCVDEMADTMTISGLTSFSDWTAGQPDAPTSVEANVGGRILTNNGQPLAGVQMNLLDTQLGQTRTSMTDANGDYHFASVPTGRDILVTPVRQGYTFSPQNQVFSHTGERLNVNFIATADSTQGRAVFNDFDGDGKSDLAVFRPSDATWYILPSSTGVMQAVQWGIASDRIVPADYDGDRKTDVAVFRPSTGAWHIYQSATQTVRSVQWGIAEDIVMPADFDGDGKADLTVFRPSTGTWYILESQTGQMRAFNWGTSGDRPVAADYDNDGKADIAVFRPTTGTWYIVNSSNNSQRAENWGLSTDRPVTGDFDGDRRADLAVFRPENGYWYVLLSGDGSTSALAHGTGADRPVPADYDGDGKTDRAVWQQADGNWLILRSSTNASGGQLWGTNGDVPTPSAYVP